MLAAAHEAPRAAATHLRCLRHGETARSEDDPRESVEERAAPVAEGLDAPTD